MCSIPLLMYTRYKLTNEIIIHSFTQKSIRFEISPPALSSIPNLWGVLRLRKGDIRICGTSLNSTYKLCICFSRFSAFSSLSLLIFIAEKSGGLNPKGISNRIFLSLFTLGVL